MAEYIEREAILEALENADPDVYEDYGDGTVDWGFGRKNIQDMIKGIPAADVAPVVHSHWEHKIRDDGENIGICHNCKYPVDWFWGQAKYCPNCGAKMDGGAE